MLHGFVSDLTKRVEGVPDEDGLIQSIRPAQERFRRAIRVTAPEFKPFEKRYADSKKLNRADFLVNEDGHEEIGSDDEAVELSSTREPIYIDEVMERAHQ
jgi:hypothetical protein